MNPNNDYNMKVDINCCYDDMNTYDHGVVLFSDFAPITSHELGLNPGLNSSN